MKDRLYYMGLKQRCLFVTKSFLERVAFSYRNPQVSCFFSFAAEPVIEFLNKYEYDDQVYCLSKIKECIKDDWFKIVVDDRMSNVCFEICNEISKNNNLSNRTFLVDFFSNL